MVHPALLVAPIAAPLLAALLAIAFPRGAVAAALSAVGVALVASLVLVVEVARTGTGAALAIGGWPPPLGIALEADGLSAMFLLAASTIGLGVLVVAQGPFGWTGRETRKGYSFWPLALCLLAALNAIFLSRDFFNFYVGLELLSLSAVALVALDGKREAIEAALRYLMFALVGSLLYLLGAALLYAQYGTLDIGLIAASAETNGPTLVAAGLMTAGLAAKTALFPLHAWLPSAHTGAPAVASAMLSALVPKASFFILVRVWFDALPGQAGPGLTLVLGTMGAVAIVYGSILALLQERLKLIIAYSTVAQLGYLFLVFPLAGGDSTAQPWFAGAWTGGMVHAVSHGLAKAAMFLCAGAMMAAAGGDKLSDVRGIVAKMPLATFAFALAAVTLMGLPPSGGFLAKYLMLTAAFASGAWVWGAVVLAGGLLAALYLYRPLASLFAPADPDRTFTSVPLRTELVPLALALVAVLLGVASQFPYDILQVGRSVAAEAGLE
ncbi:complex I subunit 5 family protein [Pelagibacterium montanilacus]|uniref:complex I subunit 5 family protein n=1 Tax=Pelagibacterium montanilacus TaxID=2185280 RepID=UPI000F8D4AD3|nr:proton-conducting transporter membrane subunit [Pelagibacterium montanilacus]